MSIEEIILKYLRPELIVIIPAIYLIGLALKKATFVKDKYIPLILGVLSIVFVFFDLLSVSGWNINLIWMSIVQGVLVAGGSVYFNQLFKQLTKKE